MTHRGVPRAHGSHLGALVSAYVDRDLPAGVLHACDQHLAVCGCCRAAAEDERRLLESMRRTTTPCPSSSLQSALLGLADSAAPVGDRPQLPVVEPGAPALHRSPVRAAVLAGLAAGASAAAAFGLGMAGTGSAGAATTPPAGRLPVAAATVRTPLGPTPPLTGVPVLGVVPAANLLSTTAGPGTAHAPGRTALGGSGSSLTQSRHE